MASTATLPKQGGGEPDLQRPSTSILEQLVKDPDHDDPGVSGFMKERCEGPSAIVVARVHQLAEGSLLLAGDGANGGVYVGPLLGMGMSGRVFELVTRDGKPTGHVIKIAHRDVTHKAINAIWISMEREWELGTQLRIALQDANGALPGFMRVSDALVTFTPPKALRPVRNAVQRRSEMANVPAALTSGVGADEGGDDLTQGVRSAHFAGMIIEKLNGWEVYKRIDTPEFHNVSYVREMLFQVFSSLDKGQRAVGFFHADLGMRNVMEHYPATYDERDLRAAERAARGLACADCAGAGCGACAGGGAPAAKAPAPPPPPAAGGSGRQPHWPRPAEGAGPVAPLRGFSCNADGSRLPMGPHVEFKIIDYGVAAFDELLAQTTGGFEAEATYKRLAAVAFAGSAAMTFVAPGKGYAVQMQTAKAAKEDPPRRGGWRRLLPRTMDWQARRAAVRRAREEAAAAPPSGGGRAAVAAPAAGAPPPASPFVPGGTAAASAAAEAPVRLRSRKLGDAVAAAAAAAAELEEAESTVVEWSAARPAAAGGRAVVAGAPAPGAAYSPPPAPRMGLIEKMYRSYWRRKGDVFHLLLGLAIVLDNRTWPAADARDVRLLMSLVHHVTGVEMRAFFADAEPGAPGLGLPRGRFKRFVGWGRRMRIRRLGHLSPYNSGLTAAEALVSPFFGAGTAPHCRLPVGVEAAFPRRARKPAAQ